MRRPESLKYPWIAQCPGCKGWIHEDSPVLPKKSKTEGWCGACWHEHVLDLARDGFVDAICERCSGSGVSRRDGWWTYCEGCDGNGFGKVGAAAATSDEPHGAVRTGA